MRGRGQVELGARLVLCLLAGGDGLGRELLGGDPRAVGELGPLAVGGRVLVGCDPGLVGALQRDRHLGGRTAGLLLAGGGGRGRLGLPGRGLLGAGAGRLGRLRGGDLPPSGLLGLRARAVWASSARRACSVAASSAAVRARLASAATASAAARAVAWSAASCSAAARDSWATRTKSSCAWVAVASWRGELGGAGLGGLAVGVCLRGAGAASTTFASAVATVSRSDLRGGGDRSQ